MTSVDTQSPERLPPLIDIGVNLDASRLARQASAVVERAARAGVRGMILTGTSPEVSARCADYARDLTRREAPRCTLWSTAGVHPHDAEAALDRDWRAEVEALLKRPEVVAVGEVRRVSLHEDSPERERADRISQRVTAPLIADPPSYSDEAAKLEVTLHLFSTSSVAVHHRRERT